MENRRIAVKLMDDFEVIRTLETHPSFTVFDAQERRFGFPVVLKVCAYKDDSEAEFFIRSALTKARDKVYSQPLLSILADRDSSNQKPVIAFVWKSGSALDEEVRKDRESEFPKGKIGYQNRCKVPNKANTKRAQCLTLGTEVILKIYKHLDIPSLNSVLKEALISARCSHPNTCKFLDFRLFSRKKETYCTYIVMESLGHDLAEEMRIMKQMTQAYDEVELTNMLRDVAAALLYAKTQSISHRDIKPLNILRSPQGVKLANFEPSWLRESASSRAESEMYLSPEASMGKSLQRPFESDVFALGMTMLHLAALELPPRTGSNRDLQALLEREVDTLQYSDELKGLMKAMLRVEPADRPLLESVQEQAAILDRRATQEALGLRHGLNRMQREAVTVMNGIRRAMDAAPELQSKVLREMKEFRDRIEARAGEQSRAQSPKKIAKAVRVILPTSPTEQARVQTAAEAKKDTQAKPKSQDQGKVSEKGREDLLNTSKVHSRMQSIEEAKNDIQPALEVQNEGKLAELDLEDMLELSIEEAQMEPDEKGLQRTQARVEVAGVGKRDTQTVQRGSPEPPKAPKGQAGHVCRGRQLAPIPAKPAEEVKKDMQEVSNAQREMEGDKSRQSWICQYCSNPTKTPKCTGCNTINWRHIYQQTLLKRSLSVPSHQSGPIVNDQINGGREEYKEDCKRLSASQVFYCEKCQAMGTMKGLCAQCVIKSTCQKCLTQIPSGMEYCPKCEKRCNKCRKIYDANSPCCMSCQASAKKMCKKCNKTLEVSGPSGLCKNCSRVNSATPHQALNRKR